jgi:hypothetical protein
METETSDLEKLMMNNVQRNNNVYDNIPLSRTFRFRLDCMLHKEPQNFSKEEWNSCARVTGNTVQQTHF